MKRLGAIVCLLGLPIGSLEGQRLGYEGSLAASTGRYLFTQRTNAIVFTNGAAFRVGRLTLRGAFPVWWQNSSLVTATGMGPVADGGRYGRITVRDSGTGGHRRGGGLSADPRSLTSFDAHLGDPTLSATAEILRGNRMMVSLGTTAKIPLADTTDLGTGQWDIGGAASVGFILGRRVTAGVDLAYWHLGDLPAFDFRDPIMASVSLGGAIVPRWSALLGVTAGTSVVDGYEAPLSVTGALAHHGDRASTGIALSIGLSETVADVTLGVNWTWPSPP